MTVRRVALHHAVVVTGGMEKVACGACELTWPSLLEAVDRGCGEGSAVLQINCYLLSFSKWGAHTP